MEARRRRRDQGLFFYQIRSWSLQPRSASQRNNGKHNSDVLRERAQKKKMLVTESRSCLTPCCFKFTCMKYLCPTEKLLHRLPFPAAFVFITSRLDSVFFFFLSFSFFAAAAESWQCVRITFECKYYFPRRQSLQKMNVFPYTNQRVLLMHNWVLRI